VKEDHYMKEDKKVASGNGDETTSALYIFPKD